jgi:hypothetical protein
VLSGVIAALVIGLVAADAGADEVPAWWRSAPPPPPPRVDPLRNMGIALTSMGAAGLIGSSVMIATGKEETIPPPCPVMFGCRPTIVKSYQQVAGAGLFGASLFGVLLGAPLWAAGAAEEPLDEGQRASDGRFLAGVGLTVFGAASAAAGAFAGLADNNSNHGDVGVPFAVFGTISMMVGLPLWVSGSKRHSAPDGPRMVRRSRGMMAGGITITIIGAATMGAGAIMTSFGSRDEGFRAFAGAMTFTSLGLVLAGIPMWYYGQEKVPDTPWGTGSPAPPTASAAPPPSPTPKPEIQIGPTGASMKFSF